MKELKPVIDRTLVTIGQSPARCLVNTSDETMTKQADIDAFNRLNDPSAPHRVILLVNKGTEGWNCPSLFACALARKLKTSNNFVLQVATRCLRQVPGNAIKARVYLSSDNFTILDKQLQETYGETIAELNRTRQETRHARIVLRKLPLPPLVVTQLVRTVVKKEDGTAPLRLERPETKQNGGLKKSVFTMAEQESTFNVLRQVDPTITIETAPEVSDAYAAAVDLAARYRVDLWTIYDELKRLYGANDIPSAHLNDLAQQIERKTRAYDVKEEKVDVALALVKPEGFARDLDASGMEVYTADIVYPKDREHLLLSWETMKRQNSADFGFHYSPYDFDSNPEKSFFEHILGHLNLKPGEVEDIYFTGAITNPNRTDFYVEYKDDKGKWRRYTPDFVIRRKPGKGQKPGSGKVFIVEIKAERERTHPLDGEQGRKALAIRKWEALNPDRLQYQMIFTATDTVTADQLRAAKAFVEEAEA